MTENMQVNRNEINIVEKGNDILFNMLYNSNTNNTTMKYINCELVRKDNKKIHIFCISNFIINLPEVRHHSWYVCFCNFVPELQRHVLGFL